MGGRVSDTKRWPDDQKPTSGQRYIFQLVSEISMAGCFWLSAARFSTAMDPVALREGDGGLRVHFHCEWLGSSGWC
jgi:hypothetical protein